MREKCLNPCSDGKRRIPLYMNKRDEHVFGVLILVLMEKGGSLCLTIKYHATCLIVLILVLMEKGGSALKSMRCQK